EAAGSKNPKWDDRARLGIEQFVSRVRAEQAASRETLRAAVAVGCTDPFVKYLYSVRIELSPGKRTPEEFNAVINGYHEAGDQILATNYPARRKCLALARAVIFTKATTLE